MKKIEIMRKGIGTCKVISNKSIPLPNEYAIRSLASMQILLMENDARKDQRTRKIIDILESCSDEIVGLFKEEEDNCGFPE